MPRTFPISLQSIEMLDNFRQSQVSDALGPNRLTVRVDLVGYGHESELPPRNYVCTQVCFLPTILVRYQLSGEEPILGPKS